MQTEIRHDLWLAYLKTENMCFATKDKHSKIWFSGNTHYQKTQLLALHFLLFHDRIHSVNRLQLAKWRKSSHPLPNFQGCCFGIWKFVSAASGSAVRATWLVFFYYLPWRIVYQNEGEETTLKKCNIEYCFWDELAFTTVILLHFFHNYHENAFLRLIR